MSCVMTSLADSCGVIGRSSLADSDGGRALFESIVHRWRNRTLITVLLLFSQLLSSC